MKNKITIAIFLLFLIFFSAGSFLFKNKDFSENENRYLQKLPDFTAESVISGVFEKDMENYVSDRLLGREFLIGTKARCLQHSASMKQTEYIFAKTNITSKKKLTAMWTAKFIEKI